MRPQARHVEVTSPFTDAYADALQSRSAKALRGRTGCLSTLGYYACTGFGKDSNHSKKALEFEGNYPPPWGKINLDVEHFEDVLGGEFVKKYKAREKLYRIPLKLRRYCKHIRSTEDRTECGAFLLPRPSFPPGKENFVCGECGGRTCRDCEAPLSAFRPLKHNCPGPVPPHIEDADLKDLRRGRDYQLCPNQECQLKIELLDGCNHTTCRQKSCETQFCYVCGQEAKDGSDHWSRGKPCPRWNQPDTEGAHWDAPSATYAEIPNVSVNHIRVADGNFELYIKYELFTRRTYEWLEEHDPGISHEWVKEPQYEAFIQPVVKLNFVRGELIILQVIEVSSQACREEESGLVEAAINERVNLIKSKFGPLDLPQHHFYNLMIEKEDLALI